jgi:uncharacterized protein
VTELLSLLRLNVGFIVHQTIGYSRDFDFNTPEIFVETDLKLADLQGIVRVSRTPQGLLVQVKMNANTQAECVRCLENFAQPLQVDFSELFAFDKRHVSESGLILPENGYLNLAPLLREYMLLEVPINPLCRPDCQGLCPECGGNLNLKDCGHSQPPADPRWGALQSLKE